MWAPGRELPAVASLHLTRPWGPAPLGSLSQCFMGRINICVIFARTALNPNPLYGQAWGVWKAASVPAIGRCTFLTALQENTLGRRIKSVSGLGWPEPKAIDFSSPASLPKCVDLMHIRERTSQC